MGDSQATSVWGTVHLPPSKYRGNMVYAADPGDDLNRRTTPSRTRRS